MAVATIRTRRNLTADNGRDLSPNIWWDCPFAALQEQSVEGFSDGDEFETLLSEDGTDDVYQKYIDTGNTIRLQATSATVYGGVLELTTDATDNDAPVVQRLGANAGSAAIGPYIIGTSSSGPMFKTWFEARINVSSVADDIIAFAVGLAQVGRAADNGLQEDNTGDIVDSISFLGFRTKHVNGGTAGTNALLDFVYQDGGQTAPTVNLASAATLVANTYVKVGFKYDPQEITTKRIKSYINNVEQSTYITQALIDATAFPSNDPLAFVVGTKNGTAGASTGRIDWWRAAQLRM